MDIALSGFRTTSPAQKKFKTVADQVNLVLTEGSDRADVFQSPIMLNDKNRITCRGLVYKDI